MSLYNFFIHLVVSRVFIESSNHPNSYVTPIDKTGITDFQPVLMRHPSVDINLSLMYECGISFFVNFFRSLAVFNLELYTIEILVALLNVMIDIVFI